MNECPGKGTKYIILGQVKYLHANGKCDFCKSELGNIQNINGMVEVDRVTGKPKIAHCCKECSSICKNAKQEYEPTSLG